MPQQGPPTLQTGRLGQQQLQQYSQANARAQRPMAIQRQAEANERPNDQDAQARGQAEWQRRNQAMQSAANSQLAQVLASNSIFMPDATLEREGASRPMWIGSKLILAPPRGEWRSMFVSREAGSTGQTSRTGCRGGR